MDGLLFTRNLTNLTLNATPKVSQHFETNAFSIDWSVRVCFFLICLELCCSKFLGYPGAAEMCLAGIVIHSVAPRAHLALNQIFKKHKRA